MNNLIVINSVGNVALQYSNASRVQKDVTFYFINNGLGHETTDSIREFKDMNKAAGKQVFLMEYAKRVPSGKVMQDVFTWALNEPNVETLSIVDGEDCYGKLDKGIDVLLSTRKVAVGLTSSNSMEPLESATLFTPFVLNMNVIKMGAANHEVFLKIQKALTEGFNPDRDVDWYLFSSNLEDAFRKLYSPKLAFEMI